MAGRDGGRCPPGCTCRRHRPRHRPECLCPRCGGTARRTPKPKPRRANVIPIDRRKSEHGRREDVCVCGHVEYRHDPFGCKTCEYRITHRFPTSRPCLHYRPRYSYAIRADNMTYEREVKSEGFIKHIGELATCTGCWTVVKLGETNTLTSVINARAHVQICTAHVRAKQETRRPNRAKGVG